MKKYFKCKGILLFSIFFTSWDNTPMLNTVKECDSDRTTSYSKIQAQFLLSNFYNMKHQSAPVITL